jgi:hypothetical protein
MTMLLGIMFSRGSMPFLVCWDNFVEVLIIKFVHYFDDLLDFFSCLFYRVEQELMARVISEVYAKRRDAVPHTPVTIKQTKQQVADDDDTESEESELSEVSSHESFIGQF